jgi:hypothetical protein
MLKPHKSLALKVYKELKAQKEIKAFKVQKGIQEQPVQLEKKVIQDP